MRAVVQRVTRSKVIVDNKIIGEIGNGLTVLLGVGPKDSEADIAYLAEKILNLRIFEDENGKVNLSLLDVGGELLVVSQFTLYADCRKGRRPNFSNAAPPEIANTLYLQFVEKCREMGAKKVATGEFGAYMHVDIQNNGPVTILLDSEKLF